MAKMIHWKRTQILLTTYIFSMLFFGAGFGALILEYTLKTWFLTNTWFSVPTIVFDTLAEYKIICWVVIAIAGGVALIATGIYFALWPEKKKKKKAKKKKKK